MLKTDSITPVEMGRVLVNSIQRGEVKTSLVLWELADLTAANTRKRGQHGKTEVPSLSEWADEIGWIRKGYTLATLQNMAQEARAWHDVEKRVSKRTFWQHFEARQMHKGDVDKARAWLLSREDADNITELARGKVTDSISEAILQLGKALARILTVPAKLAKGEIRGTETNFERLRFEVKRLREALNYLDRFLADEMEFDVAALDEAITRILAEEGAQ